MYQMTLKNRFELSDDKSASYEIPNPSIGQSIAILKIYIHFIGEIIIVILVIVRTMSRLEKTKSHYMTPLTDEELYNEIIIHYIFFNSRIRNYTNNQSIVQKMLPYYYYTG